MSRGWNIFRVPDTMLNALHIMFYLILPQYHYFLLLRKLMVPGAKWLRARLSSIAGSPLKPRRLTPEIVPAVSAPEDLK